MPPSGQKRYKQPYSSQHVQSNTTDPIRAYDPVYIRDFPKYLYKLYKSQTAFLKNQRSKAKQRNVVSAPTSPSAENSASNNSLSQQNERTEKTSTRSMSVSPEPKNMTTQGFKTIGKTTKSPNAMAAGLSALPSDFEHIFHYSETE